MPDILFTGEKQGKTVSLYAYKKKGEENIIFDTVVEIAGKKHLLFRERRQAHDEDRPFFNVVDFEVYDPYVYVIYSSFGYIDMDQYQPGKEPVWIRKFPIGSIGIMSYANGGSVMSGLASKWIGRNLYFYLEVSQIRPGF